MGGCNGLYLDATAPWRRNVVGSALGPSWISSLPWAFGPGGCAHRTRRASICNDWRSRCGCASHGARRRAFKWNVKCGAVESSAQSALVLNVLRLGDGGANTWAAVPSHHSGGHTRPPGSQQMAATSAFEDISAGPIGQLEGKTSRASESGSAASGGLLAKLHEFFELFGREERTHLDH